MSNPIEFHEDEYYESLVDDATLRIVILLCGQEVKDKLLYKKDDAACMTSLLDYSKAL